MVCMQPVQKPFDSLYANFDFAFQIWTQGVYNVYQYCDLWCLVFKFSLPERYSKANNCRWVEDTKKIKKLILWKRLNFSHWPSLSKLSLPLMHAELFTLCFVHIPVSTTFTFSTFCYSIVGLYPSILFHTRWCDNETYDITFRVCISSYTEKCEKSKKFGNSLTQRVTSYENSVVDKTGKTPMTRN